MGSAIGLSGGMITAYQKSLGFLSAAVTNDDCFFLAQYGLFSHDAFEKNALKKHIKYRNHSFKNETSIHNRIILENVDFFDIANVCARIGYDLNSYQAYMRVWANDNSIKPPVLLGDIYNFRDDGLVEVYSRVCRKEDSKFYDLQNRSIKPAVLTKEHSDILLNSEGKAVLVEHLGVPLHWTTTVANSRLFKGRERMIVGDSNRKGYRTLIIGSDGKNNTFDISHDISDRISDVGLFCGFKVKSHARGTILH